MYQRLPGVVDTCVGYTQGSVEHPSYEAVCSGRTGHTEAVQLTYDPKQVCVCVCVCVCVYVCVCVSARACHSCILTLMRACMPSRAHGER
jgi:hypothetical protein